MFYNRQNTGSFGVDYASQEPLVQTPVINFGALATLFSSSGLLFPPNILGIDRIGKAPMVMNFSLAVQQNVGFGTVVDVAYVGSLGRHLMWQRNLNAIRFGANFDPANADPTRGRRFPQRSCGPTSDTGTSRFGNSPALPTIMLCR